VWAGVAGGALVAIAGMARMVAQRGSAGAAASASADRSRARRSLVVLGVLACVAALAALALPALTAEVAGRREAGNLAISWGMAGWESVAGLTAVAMAALMLASALDDAMPALLAGLAATPGYWLLVSTPTHVWNRWLSSDIQQDYGTEYASIAFRPVPVWPARVAVTGAALGLAVVLARRLLAYRRRRIGSSAAVSTKDVQS
jgi:hypothetical protein